MEESPSCKTLGREVEHLREVFTNWREADQAALQVVAAELVKQAREYERRLDDLNHAHAKAEERDAEFISKDAAESATRELRTLIDSVGREIRGVVDTTVREQRAALVSISERTEASVGALWRFIWIGMGILATLNAIAFYLLR